MLEPDTDALRRAGWVSMVRHPDSPTALSFTAATLDRIMPCLSRKRPLGAKGHPAMLRDLGIVLAGVMRPGLQGVPVRVHSSSGGKMWDRTRGSQPLGHRRYWAIVEALEAAGLSGKLDGIKSPGARMDGKGQLSAAVWPTDELVRLAAGHGVTVETRKEDWRSDATLRAVAADYTEAELVSCKPAVTWAALPVPMSPEIAARMVDLQRAIGAINHENAAADIRGAGHTVTLVRRFKHSLAFGGRFYAPVCSMAPEDRQRITINGEPVAEVDVRASQLTVLLGIIGHRHAPEDAYAVPGIPRDVVKAWVIQTLGSGALVRTWSRDTAGAGSGVRPSAVWEALRPRYSFLADLPGLVPAPLFEGIPAGARSVAAGQWVAQREAAIMARAMSDLVTTGIPVLPVHDSLIVPASQAERASASLTAAFVDLAGIVPRLKVDRPNMRRAA